MTTLTAEAGWIPDVSTFGARLALVRQRMGWGNVAEAALACGVPVASWRNWERDGRKPRDLPGVVQAIAARTGVSAVWLAGFGDTQSVVSAYEGRVAQVADQQLSHTSRYQIRDAMVTVSSSRGQAMPWSSAAA